MRVLFVSHLPPHIAHEIPLIALAAQLDDPAFETAFLAPRFEHAFLRRIGVNVVDIDHAHFRTEMEAYGQFKPDVVVDDASFTTGFATALSGIPRIAIQRTGMFPGDGPRNPKHRHSMRAADVQEIVRDLDDVAVLGLPHPERFESLFDAPLKIVPGIRSIEVLPDAVTADPSYRFSGPLLLDDYAITRKSADDHDFDLDRRQNYADLEQFFEQRRQQGQPIVYMTFGTTAKGVAPIPYCVRYMLSQSIAVVTNVKVEGLNPRQQALYFYRPYFPMHLVCAHADLMIHHCGSGTYHYPLLHKIPALTIGTKCYDRDNVGMRLAELGASYYLPSPDEHPGFVRDFQQAVHNSLDRSGAALAEMQRTIALLRDEIDQTSAAFSFKELVQEATQPTRACA